MNELCLYPAVGDAQTSDSAFDLAGITRKLTEWIGSHGEREEEEEEEEEVVVVLEGMDLLLATGVVPSVELMDFVLGLHEVGSVPFSSPKVLVLPEGRANADGMRERERFRIRR